mgnify:CR=1 FL=1
MRIIARPDIKGDFVPCVECGSMTRSHRLENPRYEEYEEVWEDELEIITEHVGMHNPYMVNINQWHRVKTNGTPRVTLRVHGSHKLTFKQMEEMFDTGKMFI